MLHLLAIMLGALPFAQDDEQTFLRAYGHFCVTQSCPPQAGTTGFGHVTAGSKLIWTVESPEVFTPVGNGVHWIGRRARYSEQARAFLFIGAGPPHPYGQIPLYTDLLVEGYLADAWPANVQLFCIAVDKEQWSAKGWDEPQGEWNGEWTFWGPSGHYYQRAHPSLLAVQPFVAAIGEFELWWLPVVVEPNHEHPALTWWEQRVTVGPGGAEVPGTFFTEPFTMEKVVVGKPGHARAH